MWNHKGVVRIILGHMWGLWSRQGGQGMLAWAFGFIPVGVSTFRAEWCVLRRPSCVLSWLYLVYPAWGTRCLAERSIRRMPEWEWGGVGALLKEVQSFVASFPREMDMTSEVGRWPLEESRIIIQIEAFLVGQEGVRYQKKFSMNCRHLDVGGELPMA